MSLSSNKAPGTQVAGALSFVCRGFYLRFGGRRITAASRSRIQFVFPVIRTPNIKPSTGHGLE